MQYDEKRGFAFIKNFNANKEALVRCEYLFWFILALRRSQGSIISSKRGQKIDLLDNISKGVKDHGV